jgi:hypothetical protein
MQPRFLADEMNGDLARWLRIAGFDCLYLTGENLDNILLEIAKKEDRILLTSDRELYQRAVRQYIHTIYTLGDNTIEKLRKIFRLLDLGRYMKNPRYRCPICNTPLTKKRSDKLELPKNIKNNFKEVYYCEKCGKKYWKGSHWIKIRETFKELGVDI